jgi:hypothetical protein
VSKFNVLSHLLQFQQHAVFPAPVCSLPPSFLCSIEQFFALCTLGIACGLMRDKSGSVVPAMVLHATYNMTALIAGVYS